MSQKRTYKVQGMHCASCEILIERKLVDLPGVLFADASMKKQQVTIECENQLPSYHKINKALTEHGYRILEPTESLAASEYPKPSWWKILVFAGLVIFGFILLYRSGFGSLMTVNSTSTMPAFFIFGLLAGFSSCAALVGGIVLSLAKQWTSLYSPTDSADKRLEPYWLFNAGRIVSYALFGALLGSIGSFFKPSLTLTTALTVAASLFMIVLALQMLGVKRLAAFQVRLPKFLTGRIADETKFQGKYAPFIVGALTFFLPCGFTITAQSLALLSGSAVQGGLIMMFFALGTAPALLAIGFSSLALTTNKRTAGVFIKVAGLVVLFFALFNINGQFNRLGWPSLSDLAPNNSVAQQAPGQNQDDSNLPPIEDGKQIVTMEASATAYTPNYLIARADQPVHWQIKDVGTSGCTNAIVARNLFSGSVQLTPGQTSTIDFTPPGVGKYKFSCSMGMVNGVFEFVK